MMHDKLDLPPSNSYNDTRLRSKLIQNAILRVLREVAEATTDEMAQAFGITRTLLRSHLHTLHARKLIQSAPMRPGLRKQMWQLGEGAPVGDCDEIRRSWTTAIQLGDVGRDELVAALFGAPGLRR